MASPKKADFDLRTICDLLGKVKTKWFEIGIQLGIPHNKLKEFEEERHPMSEVINYWLSGNVPESAGPISWKTIVKALKSDDIGERGLAEEISKQHCLQENTINVEATTSNSSDEATSSSDDKMDPNVKEDLEFILQRNLRRIISSYACYVNTIRDILTEKGVTPDNLRGYLLDLPAFTKGSKGQQLSLLYDKKTELKECNTIAEIFIFLNTCGSFLDHEIFQDILNYYKIKIVEDQERLKYSEHLESFANKHKVSELVKVNPLLKKYTKDSKKLVLKFDVEQTCRLARVRNLKWFIAEILDLNPSTLQIIDIKEGCVVVTFLIPTSVADIIFTSNTVFTPQQQKELRANSVLWLECNGHMFDFREVIPAYRQGKTTITAETYLKTKDQPSGDLEKVRKQLAKLFTQTTDYQGVIATPLHSAVESHDIDKVRKLLKGKDIALHNKAKPQLSETLPPKLLSDHEGSKLKELGIFDKIVRNMHADATKLTTPLHRVTESHDVGKVREVLGQAEYSVDCTDSIGWTPLHYACAVGDVDMVRTLISEFKADITIEDDQSVKALDFAALAGHDSVVLTLLSEYQCPDVNSALFMACAGGHTSLVRTLIQDYKADVHARYKYTSLSPLEVAALCGKDEVALTLIKEFGCDTKIKGQCRKSLLHQACIGGSVHLVRTLLHDYNADINAKDDFSNTPLHMAAKHGNDEVLLSLLNESGCDTKLLGYLGKSILHFACIRGSADLVRTLIHDHNANVNTRDYLSNTPLHEAAKHGNAEVVQTLIKEFHCDTKTNGHLGMSLLHLACYGGSINLVRTLIREHDADVNARDDDNNTPLNVAALCNHDDLVTTLVTEFGCKQDNDKMSLQEALHEAALHGNEEVALALIKESGYDIKVKDRFGRSLLHQACYGGNDNLVRTLIYEHHADINARDDNNNTPLDVAIFCGHDELVVILMTEFGCEPSPK